MYLVKRQNSANGFKAYYLSGYRITGVQSGDVEATSTFSEDINQAVRFDTVGNANDILKRLNLNNTALGSKVVKARIVILDRNTNEYMQKFKFTKKNCVTTWVNEIEEASIFRFAEIVKSTIDILNFDTGEVDGRKFDCVAQLTEV